MGFCRARNSLFIYANDSRCCEPMRVHFRIRMQIFFFFLVSAKLISHRKPDKIDRRLRYVRSWVGCDERVRSIKLMTGDHSEGLCLHAEKDKVIWNFRNNVIRNVASSNEVNQFHPISKWDNNVRSICSFILNSKVTQQPMQLIDPIDTPPLNGFETMYPHSSPISTLMRVRLYKP